MTRLALMGVADGRHAALLRRIAGAALAPAIVEAGGQRSVIPRWRLVLPHVIEGIVAVLIAWQLALVVIEVRRPVDALSMATASPSALTPPDTAMKRRLDESALAQLVGAHLFGEVPPAPAVPAVAPSSLQLIGVFFPEDRSSTGPALIEGVGGSPSANSAAPVEGGESAARIAQQLEALRALWGAAAQAPAPSGVPIAWLKEAGGSATRVAIGESFAGGMVKAIEAAAVTLTLGGQDVRIAFPENPFIAMFRGEPTDPSALARATTPSGSGPAPALPVDPPPPVEPEAAAPSLTPDVASPPATAVSAGAAPAPVAMAPSAAAAVTAGPPPIPPATPDSTAPTTARASP